MSKTVASWFGRTHSKSLSKDLGSSGAKPATIHPSEQQAEENKENSLQKDPRLLQKSESLPSNLIDFDSDEDSLPDEPPCAEFDERELGPLVSLKQQLEKDKEDDSLRRWKAQLLGVASLDAADEFVEPDVKVLSLGVQAKGRPDVDMPLPLVTNARGYTFSLKEGSTVRLKFVFTVRNNIVSGLSSINTVWKAGLKVDQTNEMLGTFAPQQEPYVHMMDDEVTPSGALARGAYTARKRFIDDDGRVYLDINYSFEIRKDW